MNALSDFFSGTVVSIGRRFIFAGLVFLAVLNLQADAPPTKLNIRSTGTDFEGRQTFQLGWDAISNATYLVQSAGSLAPGVPWETVDLVTPVGGTGQREIRGRSIPENSVEFFRLVLPQPEIFSVEPAFIDSSDPTALLYIIGQCLPTNGTILINGQNFTPTLVDSNGGWVAVSLNGLPPGTPVIGNILVLDNASNIVTTLPLQTPVLYGTEMTAEQLQGPPEEPPASPSTASLGHRKKYKNGEHIEPDPKLDSASEGTFEIQEGKKGLNAVNVKLARMAGGSAPVRGITGGVIAGIVIAARSSGELQSEETDLAIEGRGLDFAWTRTYRSRTGPTTAQGAGWDFSYNVSLAQQSDGTMVLRPGNGRADTFYPNGTNGWSRDEYFVAIRDLNSDTIPDVLFPDGG